MWNLETLKCGTSMWNLSWGMLNLYVTLGNLVPGFRPLPQTTPKLHGRDSKLLGTFTWNPQLLGTFTTLEPPGSFTWNAFANLAEPLLGTLAWKLAEPCGSLVWLRPQSFQLLGLLGNKNPEEIVSKVKENTTGNK